MTQATKSFRFGVDEKIDAEIRRIARSVADGGSCIQKAEVKHVAGADEFVVTTLFVRLVEKRS